MKKKIMAFLLATAMVVGSAASASAVDGITVNAIKADKYSKTGATFAVNKAFDFETATSTNEFDAAWANKSDDTSKGLVAAWRAATLTKNTTITQKNWETYGAYSIDEKIQAIPGADNYGVYGKWATPIWNDAKTTVENLNNFKGLDTTKDYVYASYDDAVAGLFAIANTDTAILRSGYGVILKDKIANYTTWLGYGDAGFGSVDQRQKYNTAEAKIQSAFSLGLVETSVTKTQIAANNVLAFVRIDETQFKNPAMSNGNGLVSRDNLFAEALMADGTMKALVYNETSTGVAQAYYYDEVSPYVALEFQNVYAPTNTYGQLMNGFFGAQEYDLNEVIIDSTSLEDDAFKDQFGKLKATGVGYDTYKLGANNSAVWHWNDIYARDMWHKRNGLYKEADAAVKLAWKTAVSPDMIAAYNAAGDDKINDDALIGKVYYVDLSMTTGKPADNKYTLVSGTVAKNLTNGFEAVKVLHWTGSKWEQKSAEAVRLMDQKDDASYGVLIETNSYSPYIIIGVEKAGTGADATADAAKNPEKSGKTGVSFLGL